MAYFLRRGVVECAVIALHPDDREEVIATGLAIGDAEDLCVSKIEALRTDCRAATAFGRCRACARGTGQEENGRGQLAFRFK
jgi:hypothetical protein